MRLKRQLKRISALFIALTVAFCGVAICGEPSYAATKVKIGQACGGNNGYGDKSGKEVCISNWTYSSSASSCFHWDYVFRFDDPVKAEKAADAMEAACKNNNVGYENGTKAKSMSFTYAAMDNNWDIAGITTPCGTACSQLVLTCVQAAGINSTNKNFAYSNSAGAANKLSSDKTNFTTLTDSCYRTDYKQLRRGDILISSKQANRHTCMVVENGINANCNLISSMPAKNKVALSWGKTAGATKYNIYMSSNGTDYSSVDSTTNLSYTYTVDPSYSNKTLYFKIKPYEGSTAGTYSIVTKQSIGDLGGGPFEIVMTASKTNLRTGPGTSYKKAGTVKKGETYSVTAMKSDWGQLESNGYWVRLSNNAKITSGFTVEVTVKTLNMRSGPGTNYKNKGKLPPGKYEVSKINGKWRYLKDKKVWVSSNYAKRVYQ